MILRPAVASFATRAKIDVMLVRLKPLSDDQLEAHPDENSCGHLLTLYADAGLLRQVTDSAFREGEHAA